METRDFAQARNEYRNLKRQLADGEITPQDFESHIHELVVSDEQGHSWRMAGDGKWYLDNGQRWDEDNPPQTTETSGFAPSPDLPEPSAAPPPPYTARRTGWSPWRVLTVILILGLLVFDGMGLLAIALRNSNSQVPSGSALVNPLQNLTETPPLELTAPAISAAPTTLPPETPGQPLLAPAGASTPARPGASPTPLNLAAIPTAAPLLSPTRSGPLAPGVYVVSLRLDPPQPKRQQNVTFYVTFLNTMPTPQPLRWVMFLYRPNVKQAMGQTSADKLYSIPVGTSELAAWGAWKLQNQGPCEDLLARAAWLNESKQPTFFLKTDGQVFERAFSICP